MLIKLFGLLFIIVSCIPLTKVKYSTPAKAFKYPRFTEKDSLRGTLNRYRTNFDVVWYNLDVKINPENKTIAGFVDIFFKKLDTIDTIQLDLYQNMLIDSIMYGNMKLPSFRKYDAFYVLFSENSGLNTAMIRVYYHGKPIVAKRPPWEGGTVWEKDKNKNPWLGVACEGDGASLWWPCKDHLSDEPDSMTLNFTIPKGLKCISNGKLTDSVQLGDWIKYKWRVTYPINTYNATYYVGDFRHFSIPYKGIDTSFNLDFYVLPENYGKALEHFKQTVDILHCFEKRIGSYPWPRDGFKLVESPFEGMEHQTAIAYGHGYKNWWNFFDPIILHESAHEWWGNSITVADVADVWLQEGFATYSEAMYIEETKGKSYYNTYINFFASMIKNERPLVGPRNVNYWDYKDTDVYMKGALLLHTLRNIIRDDSVFTEIIKTYYNKNKYKIVTNADFIEVVNEKTGKDYNWFFDFYLYNRTCPLLKWEFTYNYTKGKVELYYKWANLDFDFPLPVKVKIASRIFIIRPTTKIQVTELPYDDAISINYDNSFVATQRGLKIN